MSLHSCDAVSGASIGTVAADRQLLAAAYPGIFAGSPAFDMVLVIGVPGQILEIMASFSVLGRSVSLYITREGLIINC